MLDAIKIKIENCNSEEELKTIYNSYPQFSKDIYSLIVTKQSVLTALGTQMVPEKSIITHQNQE